MRDAVMRAQQCPIERPHCCGVAEIDTRRPSRREDYVWRERRQLFDEVFEIIVTLMTITHMQFRQRCRRCGGNAFLPGGL